MAEIKSKRRRCKICRAWFHHKDFRIWWCCPEHGTQYALIKQQQDIEKRKKAEAQLERHNIKIRKLAVKPISYFHKQAQQAFNEFIRTRDAGQPCISCGRSTGAKMNAGHYRTVGASKETRYDENNCHLQCEHCNSYGSGNIENYTPNLIAKIGRGAFERLMGPHEAKKWTREDLQELKQFYKDKTKQLIRKREKQRERYSAGIRTVGRVGG